MSWSIEEHIGEGRPWPAQVVVYRGETSECLAYVSGEVADRLKVENAKLRERIVTQKQTIQSYRDESREWHEVADNTQAEVVELRKTLQTYESENAKLRELVRISVKHCDSGTCDGCPYSDMARELGIEVDG